MKRENGFYWVKWAGEWEVAQWFKTIKWQIPGIAGNFEDSHIEQIDERRIINPNE